MVNSAALARAKKARQDEDPTNNDAVVSAVQKARKAMGEAGAELKRVLSRSGSIGSSSAASTPRSDRSSEQSGTSADEDVGSGDIEISVKDRGFSFAATFSKLGNWGRTAMAAPSASRRGHATVVGPPSQLGAHTHAAMLTDDGAFERGALEVRTTGERAFRPAFCVFSKADGGLQVYESADAALVGDEPLAAISVAAFCRKRSDAGGKRKAGGGGGGGVEITIRASTGEVVEVRAAQSKDATRWLTCLAAAESHVHAQGPTVRHWQVTLRTGARTGARAGSRARGATARARARARGPSAQSESDSGGRCDGAGRSPASRKSSSCPAAR